MKTKVQIVQELLDSKKISAEDAVILLMETQKEYIPVNTPVIPWPVPYNPYPPMGPIWQVFPEHQPYYTITCQN